MSVFEDKVRTLNELYKQNISSSLVCLRGEMGLGKSYTINQFIRDKQDIIHIKQLFSNDYFLMPFLNTLPSIKDIKNKTPYLSESEIIRIELIKLMTQSRCILIFESINTYKSELLVYCSELIQYILSELAKENVFIIIEIDTDIIAANEKNDVLTREFLALSFEAYYINFKKITEDTLKKIFIEGFNCNIKIHDTDWKYIANSSFGNIKWLLLIINYLKQEEYIYYSQENRWECLHIPENELDNIISKYIDKRYERLDDHLKTILQKSSLIGPVFIAKQLKRSFQLLQIEQELIQIEKISELIHKMNHNYDTDKYIFESEDTHRIIQSMIPKKKYCSWNNILAQYYEKKITGIENESVKKFQLYRKIAIYYENAYEFQKSITFYLRAIHVAINLMDGSQALSLIRRADELLYLINNSDEYFLPLYLSEAKCLMLLGDYESELHVYSKILEKCNLYEKDLYDILFKKACALYNNDQNMEALEILKSIEIKLPELSNNYFTMSVFREFSAIYYFCRIYDKASDYFTQALHVCQKGNFEREYFLLLRQSSMFWDLKISRRAQLKALEYFSNVKDIKEKAKVCHNLGTDALWLGDKSFAFKYLNIAIENFTKFGCSDIHYSYNCLGVYCAAYENDYEKSIYYFKKMRNFKTDLFSKLVSIINCASCYCAIGNFKKCEYLINTYEDLLSDVSETIPPYLIYYYITKAIYLERNGYFKESFDIFSKCLKLKLKNDQSYLIGCHLKKLCDMDRELCNDDLSIDIDSLCSISHSSLYDKFYMANLCLSTLRFWW